MTAPAGLRRVAVFGVVFGAAMALVVWQAGSLRLRGGATDGDGGERSTKPPDEPVVVIDTGAAMGRGRGIRVSRDAVEVVDGEPVPYRAFEASWDRQTPVPGGTVDERRLRTEGFAALVFHRRPTREEPRPPAVEGPETTRVTSDEADLEMREGAAFRASLVGHVLVVRHPPAAGDGAPPGPGDDLTLRTDALDIERVAGARGAEDLQASTDERVEIDGPGAHIEGTGLQADLGRRSVGREGPPARLLLARDVAGRLDTRPGAATPLGADSTAAIEPVTFTCTGPAEMVEQPDTSRRRSAPWLLTLQGDVVVRQGPVEMRCDVLEVEFRRGLTDPEPVEVLRVVATGDVVVSGRADADDATWWLRTARSVTTRDARGGYDTEMTGGTLLTFDGTLRGRGTDAERGRVEIRCAGPALVHTAASPAQAGTPIRTQITFRDDVVASQWDADGALETEIRAPEVVLLGDRGGTADGRLDPETLTATGDAAHRVHVLRHAVGASEGTLRARAQAVTWRVLRERDTERLLLSGRPAVRWDGVTGMNLAGEAAADTPATLLLDAEERVEVTWRHAPETDGGTPTGAAPISALARKDVVVRRIVEERETYRLEAQALDTVLDADLQPRSFRAYGQVLVTGRGERPGAREITLRGDRLAADRAAGETSEWVRTDVLVFGQATAPAEAEIAEPPAEGEAPARHVVRGEQLRYEDGGTRVTARRGASIELDRVVRAGGGKRSDVTLRGGELRAHLRPPEDEATGTPEVLRVEGEGGVVLETAAYRVRGTTMTYDHTSGIAVARGRPARGSLRTEDPDAEPVSYVDSPEIRVELDTTAEATGRPRRVTCTGGKLCFYQVPDDAADPPVRFTLNAKGAIEVLPETASAEDDVEMLWETSTGGPRMQRRARLLCERADVTFDREAEGELRDRVRRAVANGERGRPARLFSPELDATADRVEVTGPWIELLSPWGTWVHVKRHDPAESFSCQKGRYNYLTQEFEATRARAE